MAGRIRWPALAAAWTGTVLGWLVIALALARPVGAESSASTDGTSVSRAIYWRPGPGWAGVGFFAILTAAALIPAAMALLAARGRRGALAGVGFGMLAFSAVAFLTAPMPAAACWLAAGVWPRPGGRMRPWDFAQAAWAAALVAWALAVAVRLA